MTAPLRFTLYLDEEGATALEILIARSAAAAAGARGAEISRNAIIQSLICDAAKEES